MDSIMKEHNHHVQNINNEIQWHEDNIWIKRNHILMKRPFYDIKWHEYAYERARRRVRENIIHYLNIQDISLSKSLIAPCGSRADQDILHHMSQEFYGIDISKRAVDKCPRFIETKVGDIQNSGYNSGCFDGVFSFLFFHHLHKVGFESILKEFHRILKEDGLLCILEPGNLYPPGWIISLGRKVFGNISGLVPDEAPISPRKFNCAVREAGFTLEVFTTVSYSHVRIPVCIQKAINAVLSPFEKAFVIRNMGWMLLWICRKA